MYFLELVNTCRRNFKYFVCCATKVRGTQQKYSLKELFTCRLRCSVFVDCECVEMDFHSFGFVKSKGEMTYESESLVLQNQDQYL